MNKTAILKALGRGAIFSLLIALAPLAVLVLVPLFNSQYIAPSALPSFIGLSVGFGVLIYLVGVFAKRLQKKVGRLTAFAALAGGVAIIGTALAMLPESCPGNTSGTSCSVPEAASWGLSLSLLVILLTTSWVFLTAAWRFLSTVVRKYLKWRREQAAAQEKEDFQKEVEEGRRLARDRDPQEAKAYPTPKREQRKKRKNRPHRKTRRDQKPRKA